MRRGYRLFTSGGLIAALVLVVLDVAVVLDSWRWWRGDGLWATQQLGGSLLIGLPVLLVVMATPPVLRGGSRTDTALMPVSAPRERLARFGADSLPPIGIHLLFVGGALVLSTSHGDRPDASSLAVTLSAQLLSIVFVCALGRTIGELVQHPVAVAVAAGSGAILLGFAENALPVTAGNSSYVGLELVPAPYVAAIAALVAATAIALVRLPRWFAYAPAVIALATVVIAAQQLDAPSLRPSGKQPTACEHVEAVEVCVFPGYRFMLGELSQVVSTMLTVLARNQIDPHLVAVTQNPPGSAETTGTVPFPFVTSVLETGKIRAGMVRATLLNPTWCPRLSAPEALPEEFDVANVQAYHWLEHAEGATDDADFQRYVPRFARLPEERQRELVQQFFDRNQTCEGLR